jgi:hypothetical protein
VIRFRKRDRLVLLPHQRGLEDTHQIGFFERLGQERDALCVEIARPAFLAGAWPAASSGKRAQQAETTPKGIVVNLSSMAPIPKDNMALDDRAIELTRGQSAKEIRMTTRTLAVSRLALATVAGVVCLFVNDNLSLTQESSLIAQAGAQVGNPLTPGSVAGVARRADRRAVRRDAVVGGAAVGAPGYYGAGGYGTVGMERRADRRAIRRDAVVGGAAVGAPGYYGAGGYGTVGMERRAERRAIRRDAVAGGAAVATAYSGAGLFGVFGAASTANYGPGPVEGSFIVNPNTGRWCRFEESGRRWCWTP